MRARKGELFLLVDVRGLVVQDSVEGPGPDGVVHILCVQHGSGHLSVFDRSVHAEASDLASKFVLERFLHIPGA